MISGLQSTLGTLAGMAGVLLSVAGGLLLAFALLGNGNTFSYARAILLIIVGIWFSGLGR